MVSTSPAPASRAEKEECVTRLGVAGNRFIESLKEYHVVKRRAAKCTARRPLLSPHTDGLNDAPPAVSGVAAGPQLAVGRALQAHSALVRSVVFHATAEASFAFAGPVVRMMRVHTSEAHGRVSKLSQMRIGWRR